jgi:hypothetical protein
VAYTISRANIETTIGRGGEYEGMKNRSHQETQEERLRRFKAGPPQEAIETLLNSIANFFNNEIRLTTEHHQTSLMFLGVHAVALTISYALFNQTGSEGYKHFLDTFIDGHAEDTKFSNIAALLHDWRNVLAHQWLGSVGHTVGYDYEMLHGWEAREDVTFINPKIYCGHYLAAFETGGKIWSYQDLLTAGELEAAKVRIIEKYVAR